HTLLAERWPAKPTDLDSLARFGRAGYHGVKAIALSMLRCGFQLAEWNGLTAGSQPAEGLIRLLATVHGTFRPAAEIDVPSFVQAQAALPEIQALALPDAVAELTRRYLDALDQPAADEPAADQPAVDQPAGTTTQPTTATEPTTAPELSSAIKVTALATAPRPSGLAGAWRDIASMVTELVDHATSARGLALPTGAPGSRAEQVAGAVRHLRSYGDYLAGAADLQSVALRLFALHAAHRAMLPVDAQVDQPIELIQVSSDTRTLLDPNRSTAASKLTGMQLDHFGAFLKRSWRSNDWMWGRLDGAGWLTHLLLDPRRINAVATAKDGSRVTGFLDQLSGIGVPQPPAGTGIPVGPSADGTQQLLNLNSIRAELAFLDDAAVPVPASLPLTALWVSQGRQQQVAAEELAVLAGTILDNAAQESPTAAARNWAGTVQETTDRQAAAATLLTACPVPDERVMDELGTPLMVRTAAKAAAVTAAAVNSMPQVPGPVRPFTTTVRTITLAGYRVTNLVQAWPRRMILAGLALLLVGCLLATGQSAVFGLSGALIAAVGGYLLVFGAWQTSRAVLAAVLAATAVGGAAALTFPSVRGGLFGVSGQREGWLNERVFWLGSQWWHPLLGLGVLLTVLALLGVLFARHGRSRPLIHRLPQWLVVAGAALIALAVVALLAIMLAIKGS
ncbi:MAG TPA: DUF3376 domain-containing protein, partial [Jatrophihabitans sp.]|nr:DUF3376 domain-containing protein [Jatrophihabitans sp.]